MRSDEQGHHRAGEALHVVQRETVTPPPSGKAEQAQTVREPAAGSGERKRQAPTGPPVVVGVQGYSRVRGGQTQKVAGHARTQHSTTRTTVRSEAGRQVRATGKDAAVLNAQAASGAQGAAIAAASAQAYVDALADTVRQSQALMDKYIRSIKGTPHDAKALAAHYARDPSCLELVKRSLEAHKTVRQAETRPARRRKAHGEAMNATATERKKADRLEEEKPSAWRPLTRRQWAERRREQSELVAKAERAEKNARRAVGPEAMAQYAAEEGAALAKWEGVEQERRTHYPLPRDLAIDMATANAAVKVFLRGVEENALEADLDDMPAMRAESEAQGKGRGQVQAMRPGSRRRPR